MHGSYGQPNPTKVLMRNDDLEETNTHVLSQIIHPSARTLILFIGPEIQGNLRSQKYVR